MKGFLKNTVLIFLTVTILITGLMPASVFSASPGGGGGAPPAGQTATGRDETGEANTERNCLSFGGVNLPDCIANVAELIMSLCARVLWLTGTFLNFVVSQLVVKMSVYVNSIDAINVGWKVFRDITNMLFIFILLYIAIMIIIGQSGTGEYKSALVKIIIVALLINFSLFFTKAVIDASNIAAIHVYQTMATCNNPEGAMDGCLSDRFMQALSLQTVYSTETASGVGGGTVAQSGTAPLMEPTIMIFYALGGSIFFLVSAFVFFAAGVLFLLRFVILVMLMIFSPLAFAAYAVPGMSSYFHKWIGMLLKQSFFAPVYMLITWLALRIVADPGFKKMGGDQSFAAAFSGTSTQAMGIVLNYIIVIIIMTFSLIAATMAGAYGANKMRQWGTSLRKYGQGKVGRGIVRATGVNALEKKLSNSRFGNVAPMRALRSVTTGAAVNASFGSGKSVAQKDKEYQKFVDSRTKKEQENMEAHKREKTETAERTTHEFNEAKLDYDQARTHYEAQTDPENKQRAKTILDQKEQVLNEKRFAMEEAKLPEQKVKEEREESEKARNTTREEVNKIDREIKDTGSKRETAEKERAEAQAAIKNLEDPLKAARQRVEDLKRSKMVPYGTTYDAEVKKANEALEKAEKDMAAEKTKLDAAEKQFKETEVKLQNLQRDKRQKAEVLAFQEKILYQRQRTETEAKTAIEKEYIDEYDKRYPGTLFLKSNTRKQIVKKMRDDVKKKQAGGKKKKGAERIKAIMEEEGLEKDDVVEELE